MADGVLEIWRELSHGPGELWEVEYRIISEPIFTRRAESNNPFDRTFSRADSAGRSCQGDHATEAGGALRPRDAREQAQKPAIPVSVRSIWTGETRRMNTGSAVQGVDLQSGVICPSPNAGDLCEMGGFDCRILRQGHAGFCDLVRDAQFVKVHHLQRKLRQKVAILASFARVVRCDQERVHRSSNGHAQNLFSHQLCARGLPLKWLDVIIAQLSTASGDEVMGTHHPLRIFSGSANRPLAEAVARRLDTSLGKSTTTFLKDSEIHVTIDQVVRDEDVFIIQPCSPPVNDHLMELVLYIDAFRRASAHEITAVIPYYPYGRQERMSKGREAISARVVATILESVGVSRVIFFDVHAPAIQGFFSVPVDPLTALPVLVNYFRGKENLRDAAIVSPDVGRAKFAAKYADQLGLPLVVMHKRRGSFTDVEVSHVVGDIEGKVPIIIDDVIAGGSVLREVEALVRQGAKPEVHLSITHGVILPSALELLDNPNIAELVVSDTINQPQAIHDHPKIRVVSVDKLLAQVIGRIHVGTSISDLIELT